MKLDETMRMYMLTTLLSLGSLFCSVRSMDWASFKEMPVEIKLTIINTLLNSTTSVSAFIHYLKTLRSLDKEFNAIVSQESQFRPFFELSFLEDNVFNALALIKAHPELLKYSDLPQYISERIGYLPVEMIQYGLEMLDLQKQELFKQDLNESLNIALHDCARRSYWNNVDDIYKVFALLICGADPNSKSYNNNTALIEAVYGSNATMVKLLIDKGADVNAKGYFNFTPLEAAVRANSPKLIEILLLYGADPNIKASSDQPPLKWAIEIESLEVADLLLRFGADPNAEINKGLPLLFLAASKRDKEMMHLLISYGANVSPNFLEKYKNKIAFNLSEKEKIHWQTALNILEKFVNVVEVPLGEESHVVEKNLNESLTKEM